MSKKSKATITTEGTSDLKAISKRLAKMEDLLDALANQKFTRIVTVVPGTWGNKCRGARGCRRKPKFMIFGDDGKPTMSRMESICCAVHLPRVIERLHKAQQSTKRGVE